MALDEAVDLVIEAAIELGYISTDEEAETVISVELINDNDKTQERKKEELKEKINKSFQNKGLLGKAEDKEFENEFKEEANLYDVSPGFLRLAKEVVFLSDNLSLEEALELSRKELLDIVKEVRKENKQIACQLKEEFLAEKELILAEYLPQIEELKEQKEVLKARLLEIKETLETLEDEEAIDLLVAEKEDLKEELENLKDSLRELKEMLKEEVKDVRDEFHEESKGLKEEIKEQKRNRKNEHQEKVEAFKEEKEERRKNNKEEIKEFQNKKGKNREDREDREPAQMVKIKKIVKKENQDAIKKKM